MTLYWSELPIFCSQLCGAVHLCERSLGYVTTWKIAFYLIHLTFFVCLRLYICSNIMLIAAYLWKSEHCKVCRWKLKVSYFLSPTNLQFTPTYSLLKVWDISFTNTHIHTQISILFVKIIKQYFAYCSSKTIFAYNIMNSHIFHIDLFHSFEWLYNIFTFKNQSCSEHHFT